jgi:hypothetical protein
MANTAYGTVAGLKSRIQKSDATDDTVIQGLLNAAAFCIDHWCNRAHNNPSEIDTFLAPATASARIYTTRLGYYVLLDETPSITTVAMKDSPTDITYTALAASDWVAFSGSPERPNFNRLPYNGIMISAVGDQVPFVSGSYSFRPGFRPSQTGRRGVPTLQVTAKWGYALTVPPVVTEATYVLTARWLKRGQSAWSDALASADFGMILYRQKVDPDVMMMLSNARLIKPAL